MHFIESGHRTQARRSGKDRGNHHLGDLIEGREVIAEPELIRQGRSKPPTSIRDAKPVVDDKAMVRCRQIVRAGEPQTVRLIRAKGEFLSHTLKCQRCLHREQCAAA